MPADQVTVIRGDKTPLGYFDEQALESRNYFSSKAERLAVKALGVRRRRKLFRLVLGILSATMGFLGAAAVSAESAETAKTETPAENVRYASLILQLVVSVLGMMAAAFGSEEKEREFSEAVAACDSTVATITKLKDNRALIPDSLEDSAGEAFVHLAMDVLRGSEDFANSKIPLHR